jgi:predicted HAD superfamily phosphohydrolase YqeG
LLAAATTTTPDQIRAVLEIDKKRVQQVTGLVVDLDQQLAALAQIPGDDSKRFRQTIWFDSIKAKAELAYLQAHMQALGELLGGK